MTTPGSTVHDASAGMPQNCRTRVLRCMRAATRLVAMRRAPWADRPEPSRLRAALAAAPERLRTELIAALAPPACLACRGPLRDASAELCVVCRRALPWLTEPCCHRCGLPAPCGSRCPAARAAFERAW